MTLPHGIHVFLSDVYAVAWLATWGNNMAWLESLAVTGALLFARRDAVGRKLAAWWAHHHGPHAIAQHREALRQHEEALKRKDCQP